MTPRSRSSRPGLVLRRSLAVLARNLPACLTLALIVLAPVIAWAELAGYPATGLKGGKANTAIVRFVVTAGLGSILLSPFLAGAVTHLGLATLAGEPASFLRAIAAGLRRLAPAFGVAVLAMLAVLFGTVALVVPGILLVGLLHVAVPAAVAERSAVAISGDEALRRGAELARPRWPAMLALALVPALAAGGLALGLARLVVPHVAAGRARVPAPAHWGNFVALTLGLFVIAAAFSAVTAVVSYAALRESDDAT